MLSIYTQNKNVCSQSIETCKHFNVWNIFIQPINRVLIGTTTLGQSAKKHPSYAKAQELEPHRWIQFNVKGFFGVNKESSCDTVANALDCNILENEFKRQSSYCVHFPTNIPGKGLKPRISFSYRI